ncbi:MAG: mannose-1-phosphate guanylyltransferase/mannose-6-phosphate isomerase [Burkholderiales bacterium]|nr:mannose-1-phosphate guanylyltransferase/mannose-6-phosphate isomerase [Burkholderiales bacterium]
MIVVIISGGSGSRLWPVSRQLDPKPFIKLADGHSLLQNTFMRAAKLTNVHAIVTVTNEKVHFRMQDEYQAVNHDELTCDFILEPYGRNTAPAIASACLFIAKNYTPDETILVLPADHLISDFTQFNQAVDEATTIAEQGYIATFGITPEYPETGYGSIEADTQNMVGQGYRIKRFVEKPDLERAHTYLASHNYLWNSGMFCGTVTTFLAELEIYAKQLLIATNNCLINSHTDTLGKNKIVHLNRELFLQPENISIDYALFEKSTKTAVLPCSIGWSDIGSWLSIAQTLPKDKHNNALIGESILHNTQDCLIYSTNRIIAGVDIKNLVIVDTGDAVLVADKNNAQNVKIIFEKLKTMQHHTSELHQTAHRPWGTYTILDEGPFYKIKRLEIKPQAAMSLQMHNHRNEHWIVVDGIATVTKDQQFFELTPNQSAYIEAKIIHRLENKTDKNLIIIEVQCGLYLNEDDIIRFDDKYGRSCT